MKKKLLPLIVLTVGLSLVMLSSCRLNCVRGSGNKITETRKMGNFSKIEISGHYHVTLKQDSSENVIVNADDNLMKYIKTEMDGDKLKIYNKKNICGSGELEVIVGLRELKSLEASGAVDVASDGKIVTKDIHFDLSGATKIVMQLDAANVTTDGSGATRLELSGQASSHHISLSGACKLRALDFVVGDYYIETSGASKCEINVLNSLDVHTSGVSTIRYRGDPKNVNNDKSGMATLEKVN